MICEECGMNGGHLLTCKAVPVEEWPAVYWPTRWMTREELEKEFPPQPDDSKQP